MPDAKVIQIPERDTAELTQLVARTRISVDSLEIHNTEDYQAAGELLLLIAERRAAAWDFLKDDIKTAHLLHTGLTQKRTKLVEPWDKLRAKVEAPMRKFRDEQARLDQLHQQESAKRSTELQSAASKQSIALKEKGDFVGAREVESQVQQVLAMGENAMVAPPEKVKGIRESEVWEGTCSDPLALIKAVAAGQIPLMHTVTVAGKEREEPLFTVSQRILDMMAGRLRQSFSWPGCSSKKGLSFGVSTKG